MLAHSSAVILSLSDFELLFLFFFIFFISTSLCLAWSFSQHKNTIARIIIPKSVNKEEKNLKNFSSGKH